MISTLKINSLKNSMQIESQNLSQRPIKSSMAKSLKSPGISMSGKLLMHHLRILLFYISTRIATSSVISSITIYPRSRSSMDMSSLSKLLLISVLTSSQILAVPVLSYIKLESPSPTSRTLINISRKIYKIWMIF